MSDQRFKICTFNLYNLALPEKKYYNRSYSKADYRQKSQWIQDQLNRIDGDIIGFQEIFHPEAMQEILLNSGGYDKAKLIVRNATGDRPAVGLVTRFKPLEINSITDFPEEALLEIEGATIPLTKFSRPVLCVRLQIREALTVVVFVVHLKSKNPMIPDGVDRHDPIERAKGKARSLIRRAAEATALRHLVLTHINNNNEPAIVLGDINDTGHAVTSEIVTGSPPWRRLPFERKLQVWDSLLYNVKDIQARQSYRDAYYTHIHNGHYESLDHIMVSQEFVRENPKHVGYVEYVQVLNDHILDDTLSDERIPNWQSDHGQVVATIRIRK
ncbi:MAG: endonuclease/exonuclease/phosphatase family protein [Chloroflexota bacterium]